MKTFKYRLYPTKAQRTAMQKTLNACRWVYNKTLEVRRAAWTEQQKSLSLYDTNRLLPGWKQENTWLSDAYSQCLQNAQVRLDLAFQAFFRRVKMGEKPGYPRFQGRGRYDSFTYPQRGFKLSDCERRLYLSKIGHVKIKVHRSTEGQIKTLTIRRDSLGNWWACFSCKVESEPLQPTHEVIGIDLGLVSFATLSTGEKIANPRFFRRDERELSRTQRKLSSCKKGSSQYRKYKRTVQHIHQRIVNRRRNFAHQLSRRLVNRFQLIAFEDLDIRNMQSGNWHGLNKSVSDAAWNQLVRYTMYKAEWAGRRVVEVDPHHTTQMCSQCCQTVPKDLSEHVHSCPHCGLVLDRDHNAALNILARGLACMGSIPRSSSF